MRTTILYVLGAALLSVIVSSAWWTHMIVEPQSYQLEEGQTVVALSNDLDVPMAEIANANNLTIDQLELLGVGDIIEVPAVRPAGLGLWTVHIAGIGAEMLGVLLSLWLGIVAGIVPKGYRQQIFGISAALGIASYAGSAAVAESTPLLTPEFIFGAVKDGFAWAAAFPLFAILFGFRRLNRDSSVPAGDVATPPPSHESRERPVEQPTPSEWSDDDS